METFLKSIPRDTKHIEIMHPVGVDAVQPSPRGCGRSTTLCMNKKLPVLPRSTLDKGLGFSPPTPPQASLDPTLVRRRLRIVSLHRAAFHRRRILGWGLATVPQLPLLVTPLPNVTVYYSIYR